MPTIKKPAKKMQAGGSLKPTYKNLGLARSASNNAAGRDTNTPATKKDSLDYKKGFDMGKAGKKPSSLRAKYEGKNQYEEKGRWEGQNSTKTKTMSKAKNGKSFPDLNKDGKITKADILKGRGVIAKSGTKIKKAQDGYSANEDSKSKLKSADGNYKTKFEWKKGESKPSQITERRTLKGFLTGAKKAQGKLDMSKMKNGGKAKSGASMKKCKYGCK
jgi:hypothetical protein